MNTEYVWFADTIRTLAVWVGISTALLIAALLLLMVVMWRRANRQYESGGRNEFGRPEPHDAAQSKSGEPADNTPTLDGPTDDAPLNPNALTVDEIRERIAREARNPDDSVDVPEHAPPTAEAQGPTEDDFPTQRIYHEPNGLPPIPNESAGPADRSRPSTAHHVQGAA